VKGFKEYLLIENIIITLSHKILNVIKMETTALWAIGTKDNMAYRTSVPKHVNFR